MERRVLIAIFLSFIVLYAYQAFVVKPTPKPPVTSTSQGAASRSTATPTTSAASPQPPTAIAPAASSPALVGDSMEREIRIETHDVIAVLSNRGARLKSWRLKKFLDQQRQP